LRPRTERPSHTLSHPRSPPRDPLTLPPAGA
jgi:hypothetical protein